MSTSARDPSFRTPGNLTLREYTQRILSCYMGKSHHTNTHNLEHAWYSFHFYMCEDTIGTTPSMIVHPQFKIVLDRGEDTLNLEVNDQTQTIEQGSHRRGSGATCEIGYDHFIPDFAIIYIPHGFDDTTKEFVWFEGLSIPILLESKRPVSRKLATTTEDFLMELRFRLKEARDSLLRYAKAVFKLFLYQRCVLCIAAVGCHWAFFIVYRGSNELPELLVGDNRLGSDDESDIDGDEGEGNDPNDPDWLPSDERNKNKKRSITIPNTATISRKRVRRGALHKDVTPDNILAHEAFVPAEDPSFDVNTVFNSLVVSGERSEIFQYGTTTSNKMLERIQGYLNTDGESWINYQG